MHVELQMDSTVVVRSLNCDDMGSFTGWTLMRYIRRFLHAVYLDGAYCSYESANVLANLGCGFDF